MRGVSQIQGNSGGGNLMLRGCAGLSLVLALAAGPVYAQIVLPDQVAAPLRLLQPVAVFGKDERRRLPPGYRNLARSIGLVYNNKARSVCTGFCVADNVVATASHCLFRTAGERRPRLREFRFVLRALKRQPSSPIAGSTYRNPQQSVVAGSRRLRVEPPIDATRDWALMRLAKPVCRGGVLAMAEQAAGERTKDELVQVSFHHDFANWKLAYSGPCETLRIGGTIKQARINRDFNSPEALVLHTCDTGGASSGSPILSRDARAGFQVVAINVGTYVQTRMLVEDGKVVRRFKSDAIANTAVAASAFTRTLAKFSRARILHGPNEIRAVQTELKSLGFYGGRVDGSFGPATRKAIQAFFGQPGDETAGLPTVELLASLRGRGGNVHDRSGAASETKTGRQTLSRGRLRTRLNPDDARRRASSPAVPVRRP